MVTSNKPDKVKPPAFHPDEFTRGWRILRQYLNLSVDLSKRTITSRTTLTVCALSQKCCKIFLNLRRCSVSSVTVNTLPCAFELVSPLDDDALLHHVSSDTNRARLSGIETAMNDRTNEAFKSAELVINLPTQITADIIDQLERLHNDAAAKPEKKSDDPPRLDSPPPVPVYDLPILHIDIDYNVLDPTVGAVFYGDQSDKQNVLDPTFMLTDGRYGMARFWMPCVDSSHWYDRYLFDFDISVNPDLVVVASGDLKETVIYPNEDHSTSETYPTSKMYKYRAYTPAHASEIVIAAGPFVPLPDPVLTSTVTHFCLPGHVRELVKTGPSLFAKALAFCREYFGSDPPSSSFKQLFVDSIGSSPGLSVTGAGGIVVHSGDLLHSERNIDEGFLAREAIMNGLVACYCGRFLSPRTSEDGWLISGLAVHISTIGLGLILGRNWYKLRIYDTMEAVRKDQSCNLSTADVSLSSGCSLDAARRRSHIIIYMIERKIGGDVLKRALRDMTAEGKRTIATHIESVTKALQKPIPLHDFEKKSLAAPVPVPARCLCSLSGAPGLQHAPTGVLSSGFDEAVQGVGVGPFLKRLRAICGADVRGMVRNWAASSGIPRMHVGYQYNPRKHTIEFVVKQDMASSSIRKDSPETLRFHGSVSIRVMEAEGAYDHSLDISEPIFATEVPCHSRRTKAVKGGVPEAINANSVTEASPLSWIRFDPENELCKELTYKQHESSWAALLEGERDVIGQLEAVNGLRGFTSEPSARVLLTILKDDQVYWRVRAEAAAVLASSEDGLAMLISFFRSCYIDGDDGDVGHLRSNNFSNIANYFVKRAMIKAVAGARVKGSCTEVRPEGRVPLEASQFLCFVLAGHDNSGNDFDDDHYVLDLLDCISKVAIACIGDTAHDAKSEGDSSTTDKIFRQIERFRSVERLVQRRRTLVSAGLLRALVCIERAKMLHHDRQDNGSVSNALIAGTYPANAVLLEGLFDLTRRFRSFETRVSGMSCLLDIYGGHYEVISWVMSYIDRTKSLADIVTLRHAHVVGDGDAGHNGDLVGKGKLHPIRYEYTESSSFRCSLLDAFVEAAVRKDWFQKRSPLLVALRRNSKEAIEICIRLLRVIVAEGDPRVRASASVLAKAAWGTGVPVCLLSHQEYLTAKSQRPYGEDLASIVPLRSHRASSGEKEEEEKPGKKGKSKKSCKSKSSRTKESKKKSSKNGKISKAGSSKSNAITEISADLPPKPPKTVKPIVPTVIDVDGPVLSNEPKVGPRGTTSVIRTGASKNAQAEVLVPKNDEAFEAPLPMLSMPRSMIEPDVSGRRPLSHHGSPGPKKSPVSKPLAVRMPPSRIPSPGVGEGISKTSRRVGARAKIELRSFPADVVEVGDVPTPKLSSKPLSTKGRGEKRTREATETVAQENDEIVAVEGDSREKESSVGNVRKRDRLDGRIRLGPMPLSRPDPGEANADRIASKGYSLESVGDRNSNIETNFDWHPLDEEDQKLLVESWQRENQERQRHNRRERHESVHGVDDVNGRECNSRGVERHSAGYIDEDGVLRLGTQEGTEQAENGSADEKDSKRDGKKKKKRKRDRDDQDDEERRRKKKKKKKKKRRESDGKDLDEFRDPEIPEGEGSLNGRSGAEGGKRIGKIQIKLPSRNAGHLSLSD